MTPKWIERFVQLAKTARTWAKGPDLGVGACLVSPDLRGISLGFSGYPRGICDSSERLGNTVVKDQVLVHAELNAILNAGRSVEGWTMFTTKPSCCQCAAAMVQAGIVHVYTPPVEAESRWADNQRAALEYLREAGVRVTFYYTREEGPVHASEDGDLNV